MIAYALILFAVAVLLLALGISVYRGNTKLIHDYHQANVGESQRREYGRAFAKGMFAMCATLFISGGLALFGERVPTFAASLIVLIAGLIPSIVVIVKAQRAYNGGLF